MASQLLEKKIESKVDIGNMRLNMLGHVILDNVKLYDRQDTLMLQASRIAAKIDFAPLFRKKIRISAAQLIGAKAKLYKDGDAPYLARQRTRHLPRRRGVEILWRQPTTCRLRLGCDYR